MFLSNCSKTQCVFLFCTTLGSLVEKKPLGKSGGLVSGEDGGTRYMSPQLLDILHGKKYSYSVTANNMRKTKSLSPAKFLSKTKSMNWLRQRV